MLELVIRSLQMVGFTEAESVEIIVEVLEKEAKQYLAAMEQYYHVSDGE